MLNCNRIITVPSTQQPQGFNMLTDFDKDLAGIDLTADNAMELILAAANTRSDGLSNKVTELLGKVSTGKIAGSESAAELENLRLFKQSADQKILEEGQQYEEAKQSLIKTHGEELEKANGRGDSFETQLKTLLINDGLSAALDGVNINKDLKAGAVAMLQAGATIIDGKAMIGDKSLSDAVKEWADTDAGKSYCLAQNNSGGDAQGGDGRGQSSSNKDWSKMSVKERAAYLETKR